MSGGGNEEEGVAIAADRPGFAIAAGLEEDGLPARTEA
jgi:hypothetical protein